MEKSVLIILPISNYTLTLSQQGEMKQQHDRHAKFCELNIGDTVLARDHLSSQLHGTKIFIKDHDCEDNIEKLFYACG